MCFFKRFSLSFVLILGTWQGIWAGEPADQTAAAAEKYQNDMIAARKQYDQAVASITADYTKILKTALTEQTQRGDLDTALMTRNKIRWLESQQAAAGNLMEKLAGTSWMNTLKVTWEWKKDGSFYRNGSQCYVFPLMHTVLYSSIARLTCKCSFSTRISRPLHNGGKVTRIPPLQLQLVSKSGNR